jgi:hypothetical protein
MYFLASLINLLGLDDDVEASIKLVIIAIILIIGITTEQLNLDSDYLIFKPYWLNTILVIVLTFILIFIGAVFNIISQHN